MLQGMVLEAQQRILWPLDAQNFDKAAVKASKVQPQPSMGPPKSEGRKSKVITASWCHLWPCLSCDPVMNKLPLDCLGFISDAFQYLPHLSTYNQFPKLPSGAKQVVRLLKVRISARLSKSKCCRRCGRRHQWMKQSITALNRHNTYITFKTIKHKTIYI